MAVRPERGPLALLSAGRGLALVLLTGLAALSLQACQADGGSGPQAEAGEVAAGLDPLRAERLEELLVRLEEQVAEAGAAGAVVLVERSGRRELEATVGQPLAEGGGPRGVPGDEVIFPIFSMTKPVVCLAAMQLVEEGRLGLEEPLSRYLEEWSSPSVAVLGPDGELLESRPASRPVTVGDLLSHTSGLTSGLMESGALGRLYRESGLSREFASNRERSRVLATLPLAFDPGTGWAYGHSTDVVGALLEVVEGESLERVLERRVLGPLGMRDTAFHVDPASRSRVVSVLEPGVEEGEVRSPLTVPLAPPSAPSGGGGLYSTASDYLRFCQLLLGRGQREGVRLLSEETFALMTVDRTAGLPPPELLSGRGFGIGFALLTEASAGPLNGREGGLHWSGIRGSSFFVDPEEELCAVFLIRAGRGDFRPMTTFRKGVYAALPAYESEPSKASGGSEVGE